MKHLLHSDSTEEESKMMIAVGPVGSSFHGKSKVELMRASTGR